MVIHLHQCTECATLTEDPPNQYGNAYCQRHRGADILPFPSSLRSSKEERYSVEVEAAVS
jgi:hypothetical protein